VKIILIISILIFFVNNLFPETNEDDFYMDAIVFKSDSSDREGRVDVMILIPYSSVNFKKESDHFVSNVEVDISIWEREIGDEDEEKDEKKDANNSKTKVESIHISKDIIAKDFSQTRGEGADFVKIFRSFHLGAGKFNVIGKVSSKGKSKEYEKTKKLLIPEYSKYKFSLSGLMLLSSIEETPTGYKITPFAKDNIEPLMDDGFFVFFETYSKTNELVNPDEKVSLRYLVKNSKGDTVKIGKTKEIKVDNFREQHFLLISGAEEFNIGSFKLQVIANSENNQTIAMSERSIKNAPTLLTKSFEDIDKAIYQLRYVASSGEIEKIESSRNEKEKQKRFFDFWEELDPTPRTKKNEAMEQYFARVEYADKKFKSSSNGWNTDRGRIFIILGPAENVSRSYMNSSPGEYEVWIYPDNRRFVFFDRNGFGDFRLEQPFGFSEKYKYR
jgi:GWxTD domain-containing protein